MSDFLETLKHRMQEAQQKFLAAQQKLNGFQAEFQAAAQEFQAWQTLVKSETAKEEQGKSSPSATPVPAIAATINNKSEGNKTEAVRELLRQHPVGMLPGDIWKQLEPQMGKRAYLYSILKRLKDRGDVRERRGKYFLNPKPEVNQGQGMVQ